jgi:hypothetical protein
MDMKRMTIILTLAGGLALPVMAADPHISTAQNSPSVSTGLQKHTLPQKIVQLLMKPEPASSYRIDRVGGVSSRPWAQVAGRPAQTSLNDGVVDAGYYQPHFNLFWIGETPR